MRNRITGTQNIKHKSTIRNKTGRRQHKTGGEGLKRNRGDHGLQTAEQRARSKWSSRREKMERRMSSLSDCAVEPEPAPTPLWRFRVALPLRLRLLLASMARVECCALPSLLLPLSLPAGSSTTGADSSMCLVGGTERDETVSSLWTSVFGWRDKMDPM
jgi:hypothetical protein